MAIRLGTKWIFGRDMSLNESLAVVGVSYSLYAALFLLTGADWVLSLKLSIFPTLVQLSFAALFHLLSVKRRWTLLSLAGGMAESWGFAERSIAA